MTDHDLQLLALGVSLGMYIMLAAQIIGGILDDRRDRSAAKAAAKSAAGTAFLIGFRRYREQQRSRA